MATLTVKCKKCGKPVSFTGIPTKDLEKERAECEGSTVCWECLFGNKNIMTVDNEDDLYKTIDTLHKVRSL